MATIATKALTVGSVRLVPNTFMVEVKFTSGGEGGYFVPDGRSLGFDTLDICQFLWRWAVANNITPAQAAGRTITFTVTVV